MIPNVASSPSRSSTTKPPALSTGTLVAACAAVFIATVGMGLPAAITGVMQQTLHASGPQLSWISEAFLVPTATLGLTFGVLGDLYGRKRILVGGAALMAIGYAVCAIGVSVHALYVGQALSGIGAAALFASSLASITAATPGAAERARGLAAWTTALSVGALVAPVLSGAVVEFTSFRWAFVAAGLFAVISLGLSLVFAADSHAPEGRSLDLPGQATITVAIPALLFGVIQGPTSGWGSPAVVTAFVLGVVFLAAFLVVEARSTSAMLKLDVFRIPAFSAAAVVAVIGMFGSLGGAYALSVRLGVIQHRSPLESAWPFVVMQGITPLMGPLLLRLLGKVAPRVMLAAGLVLTAAGQLWLSSLPVSDTSLLTLTPALILSGMGFGLLIGALTAAAVNTVPIERSGMASAVTTLLRGFGQALGPAIIGTVALTSAGTALAQALPHAGLAAAQQHAVQAVTAEGGPLALASAPMGPRVGALATEALTHGYNLGFLVTALACLVAAAISVLFLRGGRSSHLAVPLP